MAIELLTLGGFALSAGFFTAVLDGESPRLDKTRWGCLALSGAVLSITLVGRAPGWTTMLSCIAFLMSLIAVVLAAYSERDGGRIERIAPEPTWWPQFERDFEEYVRRQTTGEQQDDSHRAS